MHEPATALHTVDLASLGERLSALRLCDAASLTAMRRSLALHGQLTALTVFGSGDQLEVLDGFKRARAARALGWSTLLARVDPVDCVEAKLRLCALHDRRGIRTSKTTPAAAATSQVQRDQLQRTRRRLE